MSYGGDPLSDLELVRQTLVKTAPELATYLRIESSNAVDVNDLRTSFIRFCHAFPDQYCVVQRGPYFDPLEPKQQRLLTAGFHLMHGYYRDDGPLTELVLGDTEQRRLGKLWDELDFVTESPLRQYRDFVFFERAEPPRFMFDAEFDFARSEDKDVTTIANVNKLRDLYLAKALRQGAGDDELGAITEYFHAMTTRFQWLDEQRELAETRHLQSLQDFAERAYRRPLDSQERTDLARFYEQLRGEQQLSHADALRDCLTSVLMSPYFCYRFDLNVNESGVHALSDYELASRLSYFLWSSMPDAELLEHAAAGDLHDPNVLIAQTRRMLADKRVYGMATEFLGNWLDFRRFEEHNSVDRGRFPEFNDQLRDAMFEEPIRFFVDLIQHNRPVSDLLYAEHTYVDATLAKLYGMAMPESASESWVRIDNAGTYGRGGLLTMAVFLTKNSPGLRTSPVKRGYWVVRRLLGERIPPPPPVVPELPADETKLGELTLAETLARHRSVTACAGCHRRFDAVGLVFEDYGPIGERRSHDLGGRRVDNRGQFPDGQERQGITGLRQYLREARENDFLTTVHNQLFAYALGRSLLPSDQPTLDDIKTTAAETGYTLGKIIELMVTSPQFLNKRGGEEQ